MANLTLVNARARYSKQRLDQLRHRIQMINVLRDFPGLTIYGVGSYARLEASEHSDLDLFFLTSDALTAIDDPRTKSLSLFGDIIRIAQELNFPKFSNDCEHLTFLSTDDMLKNLGNPSDDHQNYFTARMLLLLESHCLHNTNSFDTIVRRIIQSYFRDYPDHPETFWPIFLLNDIGRFWKTLLLNYEHKRLPDPADPVAEAKKTRLKVRNFKLKYSRLTTCFASIVALGSRSAPVTEEDVFKLTKLTPRQRLKSVTDQLPCLFPEVQAVLDKYSWFLEKTGLSTTDLESHFADKQQRVEMFDRARAYGDAVYALLQRIDQSNEKPKLLRFLVV